MNFHLDILALVQLVAYCGMAASAVFYVLQLFAAHRFFGARPKAAPAFRPAVTVLKPLKGTDADLYQNLVTLCQQRYPTMQVICGVADPDDSAIAVVQRIQREFPDLDIELVVDGRIYGHNYKVSNLHNMYQRAKHDVIVLADSDVRVGPEYLANVVQPLGNPSVGVSTCIYRGVVSGGLPNVVESLVVNADFAPMVLLANALERTQYAFGATIAIRRGVLEEIGGFLPIASHLADDYEIGYRVAARGYTVEINREVVDTMLGIESWRQLYAHQVRWARTNRFSRPVGYFGSIVTHGTSWALLCMIASGFSPLACAGSAALLVLRLCQAGWTARRYLSAQLSWADLSLLPAKDVLSTAIWCAAFAGNHVVWGKHRFAVLRSGVMVDLARERPTPLQPAPADSPMANESRA